MTRLTTGIQRFVYLSKGRNEGRLLKGWINLKDVREGYDTRPVQYRAPAGTRATTHGLSIPPFFHFVSTLIPL
jgi:hypothetical protein